MGRFLDMRVSQNSSTLGFPNTAVTATPSEVGVIGLQTQNVAGTGTDGLIVNLMGTIGLFSIFPYTATINIQRGPSTVFGAGAIIYTAVFTKAPLSVGNFINTEIITINAVDLNAPAAAQTEYTLFISGASESGTITRTGPETFSGIAQNGLAPTP